MDATTIVAGYAALVATGSVAIRLAGLRGRRTLLRLEAHAGTAKIESEDRDVYGNGERVSGEVLFMEITNRSPHPVKITHLGTMSAGRRGRRGLFFARPYPVHLKLPLEIAERDRVTLWQPRASLGDREPERMRIVVRTAAGEDFESRPFRLSELTRLEALP
jgi:hypothetical protein